MNQEDKPNIPLQEGRSPTESVCGSVIGQPVCEWENSRNPSL